MHQERVRGSLGLGFFPHRGIITHGSGDQVLTGRKDSASPIKTSPRGREFCPVSITVLGKSEMVTGGISSCGKSLGKCQPYGKSWEMLVYTALAGLVLCRENRDSVSWSQHEMALRNRAYLGEKTNDAAI